MFLGMQDFDIAQI